MSNGTIHFIKRSAWDVGGLLLAVGMTLMLTEILPVVYWPGVVLFYVGAIALVYHIANDDDFKKQHIVIQKLCGVGVLLVLYLWTVRVVLVKAPLIESGYPDLGNYVAGTAIGGHPWDSSKDIELRVDLENPSDYDYHDIDLLFHTGNLTIVYAAQLSQFPAVSFFPEDSSVHFVGWLQTTDGKEIPLPPQPLDMSRPRGFRLVCDKFPKHSTMQLMFVMWSLNYSPPPLPKQMLRPKKLPNWLRISGEYRAVGRTRSVERREVFGGIRQQ